MDDRMKKALSFLDGQLLEFKDEIKELLADLQKDSDMLASLHSSGVDNWDWYYEATKEYFKDD